ncbi:hypothetical protein ACFU8Q_28315 [Streptomyces sp. NPDC057543]|uniref:hypothetical protein n=1 Tax=Streptomyces sp. NPDC057543 TaxID=3346163 RepID=UPI00368EDF88
MEETTRYVRTASGSVMKITDSGSTTVLPDGAVEITAEEYEATLAAIQAASDQKAADERAQELAAKKDAYDALIAAGIPEASARQISGYTPQEQPGQDEPGAGKTTVELPAGSDQPAA